ncbi:MAG TPA: hypothetical protein VMR50_00275 [Myxococcota bacterium]|nr:hypothetical protein [Myxococcota bacterium]
MVFARTHSAALSMAAALTLLGGLSRPAAAQMESQSFAPEPAPVVHALPPIQIRVSIARASVNDGAVDPQAQDIFAHLPAKYHSISMIEDRTVAVLLGEQAHVKLPTGGEVRLLPVAVHGGQLHLQLEMPDVVNTSMRLANSRAFYVGGVRLGEDTLVFKLVPEFAPYVSSPETRSAGVPSAPNVTRASERTR